MTRDDNKWFVHWKKYFHSVFFVTVVKNTLNFFFFNSFCHWRHIASCAWPSEAQNYRNETDQRRVWCFSRKTQMWVRHRHSRHALQDLWGPLTIIYVLWRYWASYDSVVSVLILEIFFRQWKYDLLSVFIVIQSPLIKLHLIQYELIHYCCYNYTVFVTLKASGISICFGFKQSESSLI